MENVLSHICKTCFASRPKDKEVPQNVHYWSPETAGWVKYTMEGKVLIIESPNMVNFAYGYLHFRISG